MEHTEQPDKADVIRFLLEEEGRVMLCIDATQESVEVPRRFADDNGLRLVLNRQMPQPIHVGSDKVESELRFGGIPHYCIIPYEALWGAFNPDTGHGMLWPESMPNDVRQSYWLSQSLQKEGGFEMPKELMQRKAEELAAAPLPPAGRPKLQVIEGVGETTPEETPSSETPRPKPLLRLIK
uniref:Putative stringent starvation protein B (SspB) n=1 Tax=Magnetococcus massalia (strain MO-1) TaxID=451514 RepID=A0A1S7LKQ5_MAGMO|nr:putative stringent starvation protein B (sspB) [Candidatus Magnetococcus massalia]